MIGKILKFVLGLIIACAALYYIGMLGKTVRYVDETCEKYNIPYKPSSIFGKNAKLDKFEETAPKNYGFWGLIDKDGYFYTPLVLICGAIFVSICMYYIKGAWDKFLQKSKYGNMFLFKEDRVLKND